MSKTDDFGYFEDEQVKVLRMGYKRGDAFMYLILPTERFGLDKLLQKVDGKTVLKWLENAGRKTKVFVSDFKRNILCKLIFATNLGSTAKIYD